MGKVRYQSPKYRPELVVKRYLYVELGTDTVIIDEVNVKKLTVRSYELPKQDSEEYAKEIADAEKIKHLFPYHVEIKQ